jgi:hypothetical protein
MPLTGHCLCKAVTYTADVDAPLLTGYDHCDDCQRQSGSTYCQSNLTQLPEAFSFETLGIDHLCFPKANLIMSTEVLL